MNLDKPVFKTGTKIAVVFPEEPPRGSVVIDGEGSAWQLIDDDYQHDGESVYIWVPALYDVRIGINWRKLVIDNGPLTLVWVGTPTEEAKPVYCDEAGCDGGC